MVIDPHGIVQDAQFGNPDDPTYPTDPLYPGNPVPPIDPLHPADPSNPVPRTDPTKPKGAGVHGDLAGEAHLWFDQQQDGLCVSASLSEVVAEFRVPRPSHSCRRWCTPPSRAAV